METMNEIVKVLNEMPDNPRTVFTDLEERKRLGLWYLAPRDIAYITHYGFYSYIHKLMGYSIDANVIISHKLPSIILRQMLLSIAERSWIVMSYCTDKLFELDHLYAGGV